MFVPVRCFTCGKVIGHLWKSYQERVKAGENPRHVLDDLGLKRYCCRVAIMTSVDRSDEIMRFAP